MCESGRIGHPAKVLRGQPLQGFESLHLRIENVPVIAKTITGTFFYARRGREISAHALKY